MDDQRLQQIVAHALEEEKNVHIHQRQAAVRSLVIAGGDVVHNQNHRPAVRVDHNLNLICALPRLQRQLPGHLRRRVGQLPQLIERGARLEAAVGYNIHIDAVDIQPGRFIQNIAVNQRSRAPLSDNIPRALQPGENVPHFDPADAKLCRQLGLRGEAVAGVLLGVGANPLQQANVGFRIQVVRLTFHTPVLLCDVPYILPQILRFVQPPEAIKIFLPGGRRPIGITNFCAIRQNTPKRTQITEEKGGISANKQPGGRTWTAGFTG